MVTGMRAGNSGKCLTAQIDNYWLGGFGFWPGLHQRLTNCFASKPAPTIGMYSYSWTAIYLWERACSRRGQPSHHINRTTTHRHPHPNGWNSFQLWERACSRRGQPSHHINRTNTHSPPPQRLELIPTVGAGLLAKRPAQPPQNLQTQKSPARQTPDGAFNASDRMLKPHSWSCAYQSGAAPHPDPPRSRYPPTRHIPPWQSCAESGA